MTSSVTLRDRSHSATAMSAGAALVAAAIVLLTSCSSASETSAQQAPTTAQVRDVLAAWSKAFEAAEWSGLAPLVAEPESEFGRQQRGALEVVAQLPVTGLAYAVTDASSSATAVRATSPAGGGWSVRATGTYRLAGFDDHPRTFPVTFVLRQAEGRWRVAGFDPGSYRAQLWDLPAAMVSRSPGVLIVSNGDPAELAALRQQADRALESVGAAWQEPWREALVIVAPRSASEAAEQLGVPVTQLVGIAAVTDGPLSDSGRGGADRIVLNPEAFQTLTAQGKQVVLTHESTHVAVRATTSAPVPLWLSEGFAEWVAYRPVHLPRRTIAAPLVTRLKSGQVPMALPADPEFNGSGDNLVVAYNEAWIAVDLLIDQLGLTRFRTFYRDVSRGGFDSALQRDLGLSVTDFTSQWSAQVRELAR